MKKLLFFLLSLVLLTSCDEKDDEITNGVIEIHYGTSFGECYGYCINEVTVTDNTIALKKYSWTDGLDFPDIDYQKTINEEVLEDLFDKVDFDTFLALDEVIGCPDCADGGSEWIEIKTNDTTHKVTFEYFNEPSELTEIVTALRTKNDALQKDAYVMVDKNLFDQTETDNYSITDVVLEGDLLKLSIGSSGCSGDTWVPILVDSGDVLESFPVQKQLKLNLVNQEACLAVINKTYEFDLTTIQLEDYDTIILNLEGWNESITYYYGQSDIEALLLGSWSNATYENGITAFEKVSELPANQHGFTFKEEFPTCIERTSGFCGTPPISYYDAERYYELDGNNLKIYDALITHNLLPEDFLLYNFNIISINENELFVENIIDEQTQDYNALIQAFDEIYAMISDVTCEDASDWSFIAYGSKPCGGPQGYLPYPTNINVTLLTTLVEAYTQLESDYNVKYGIASDCAVTAQPSSVECVNGVPTLVY